MEGLLEGAVRNKNRAEVALRRGVTFMDKREEKGKEW